jgi:Peptidase family M48
MKRLSSITIATLLAASCASAQNLATFDNKNPSFDDVVDHAIFQEASLLKILRGEKPIAETYIQDLQSDADFGKAPKTDHYFLGKVDLSKGVSTASFIPKTSIKGHAFDVFTHLFSITYLPRGFAQMILIDGGEFDRNHYEFEFVRREFLGDVRAWVINVTPKKSAGAGRFSGRVWVEDHDFNVVRFNGTYTQRSLGQMYMHFDSWRTNCGPDLWMPYETYSEESSLPYALGIRKVAFKAITKMWGYTTSADRREAEFTAMTIDVPTVKDNSDDASDNSPVEGLRAWERESEDNILDRMEKANLLAPPGDVEKVLDTVVNNLVVTNNLQITPEVRARVLLTTPLESFAVGHTIIISKGLLDTLPDEASLAAIVAHELAHVALGQEIDTKYAFSDRILFDDEATLKNFKFVRPQAQEDAANTKAVEYLQHSPYKDKLTQAGLFLKALGAEADRLPSLVKSLMGNRLAEGNNVTRLAGLLQSAPEFQRTHVEQVAALPLGSRTILDPWTDKLRLAKLKSVPLLSARERMPFEITPVNLHLRYQPKEEEERSADAVPASKVAVAAAAAKTPAEAPAQPAAEPAPRPVATVAADTIAVASPK